MEKDDFEPENQTICEATGNHHVWVWSEELQDHFCDECGVSNEFQES